MDLWIDAQSFSSHLTAFQVIIKWKRATYGQRGNHSRACCVSYSNSAWSKRGSVLRTLSQCALSVLPSKPPPCIETDYITALWTLYPAPLSRHLLYACKIWRARVTSVNSVQSCLHCFTIDCANFHGHVWCNKDKGKEGRDLWKDFSSAGLFSESRVNTEEHKFIHRH